MNIEVLANVGEFVGGVAVVLSLMYVGVQIRQNTKVSRAAALQAFYEENNASLLAITQGIPAIETWTKGVRDFESLTVQESTQFGLLVYRLLASFERSFFLYKDGLLPESDWHRQRGIARYWCELPGIQVALSGLVHQALDPEFLSQVSREYKDT